MEYFLNPDVIKAASVSTLGILSLMLLILGLISVVFFIKSPIWVKLVVFFILFSGTAGYAYSLKLEANRFQTEKEEAKREQIEACIAQKVEDYETPKNNSDTKGGARAPGPGWKGGKKKDEKDLCHSVGANQEIISATATNTCCHGGRCSATAPRYLEENKKVCITTYAWSESRSGGGGGCAKYRLNVTYKDIATESIISMFHNQCAGIN